MSNQIQHQPVLENDAVSRLSLHAELFLHRLLNAVDRYGCFDARPAMLRAKLFPLKLDDVTEAGISEWLTECVNAGLIKCYEVEGRAYLCVAGFKRRMGSYKTPYPEPPIEETDDVQPAKPTVHDGFVKELYKRENARYLNELAERIRQPQVKRKWVQAFNEHLCTEGKHYTIDHEWLAHLKKWLPQNIHRLQREEKPVDSEKIVIDFALAEV